MYSIAILLISVFMVGCYKDPRLPEMRKKTYPPDVAVAWMNIQLRLTKGTPGFNSIVSNRSYAYVGLTLYESLAPGMPGLQSITPQLNGAPVLPNEQRGKKYYWPASANAALAFISKSLFANTTPSLAFAIDSLEADFNSRFGSIASPEELQRSAEFGLQVAKAIFEWSKTDGGHEAYNNITSSTYLPPAGPGLWIPTPPAFGPSIHPFWGNNRTFIPNLVSKTAAAPPPTYSGMPGSPFYMAANEIYTISQNLSSEDTLVARFWADLPANYNVPAHAANIVTQLVLLEKLSLHEAAILFCKHGIAGNDGIITCFAAKYKYNLLRPVTYIRSVLGQSNWSPLIPTPPFPEFTSAHAVVSTAFSSVLENAFGNGFDFTDRTYESLYGARHFHSFEEYADEAANSRLFGGIHYSFGATEGKKQGKKVGVLVNKLKFHNGNVHW
jgi:hypothetical protein